MYKGAFTMGKHSIFNTPHITRAKLLLEVDNERTARAKRSARQRAPKN